MHVSLVVPVYNEILNIPHLQERIHSALEGWEHDYEIVVVDDGSTDGGAELLIELARTDPRLKVVCFRRNYGQTAAMQAGLHYASGEVIVTLDGDLQNDPADIPMMVATLEEGCDLVHGWRQDRQDDMLTRKIPSKIANWLISKVTGVPIRDLGCTLKAIRREIADDLELYGEMHRFIPILAHWHGARCREVVTRHHPRQYGTTKYGLSRTFRVLLDLMTVKFLLRYSSRPMHLFGGIGLACGVGGVLSGLTTLGMKLFFGSNMTGNPLLLLTVLLTILAIQFCSLGLISEVSTRIYFGTFDRQSYSVRRLVNFEDATDRREHLKLRRAA
jgi:glycosyltransferase involved in cell wall biosynthesis